MQSYHESREIRNVAVSKFRESVKLRECNSFLERRNSPPGIARACDGTRQAYEASMSSRVGLEGPQDQLRQGLDELGRVVERGHDLEPPDAEALG